MYETHDPISHTFCLCVTRLLELYGKLVNHFFAEDPLETRNDPTLRTFGLKDVKYSVILDFFNSFDATFDTAFNTVLIAAAAVCMLYCSCCGSYQVMGR